MALAYADHSFARKHLCADQNVARTRCEYMQLQGWCPCVLFVDIVYLLYMIATLHACYIWSFSHRIDFITCMNQTTAAETSTIRTQSGRAETTHALPQAIQDEFQHRISMPKRKNCICQALEFASRQNPKKIASRRSAETELQNTIELRTTASEIVAPKPSRAAKDNSITNAATARSNLDTAITMWSAETELQNTTELRTTASEIVAPKPVLDPRAKKRRFWSTF